MKTQTSSRGHFGRMILTGLAGALIGSGSVVQAEELARYEFPNALTSAATPSAASATEFADGPGYNTPGATGFSSARRYVLSQAIQSGAASTGLANGDYFEFTVTPDSGYGLNLESLQVFASRASSSPDRVSVFTSVDGYTTPVINNGLVAKNGSTHTGSLLGPEFQGIGAITFRVVGHGGNVNLAGPNPRIHFDNVVVQGSTAPIEAAERWSNPATWGGTVPAAGQNVIIPAGKTVLLDVNTPSLGILEVNGTLRFDPSKDVNLTAHHIIVYEGTLEIGTAAAPYTKKAIITLTGSDPSENIVVHTHNTGAKGLIVMNGTLELHGHRASATAFTKLTTTANPGATQISVADTSTGWRVGDQIVIAPSGFNLNEAEKVQITAINQGTISFTPALQFAHWGQTQTVQGKVLDMRAEVALLTRDIVIQGDATSDANFYGGHVMLHMGAFARAQGVEFRKMGQRGKQGRYPWHWHFTGDCSGQWIRNSSVWESFHRAYATHQVDNAEVSDCVAYDVWSHMYVFAEDGPEYYNIYRGNIGIKCKTLAKEHWAFVNNKGESSQGEKRGSVFWGKRPNQIMENNVAVGTDNGQGFFFDPDRKEQLANAEVTSFVGNVAHAIGGDFINNITYPPGSRGNGIFVHDYQPVPAKNQDYGNFMAYKCTAFGIWVERRDHFSFDSITADCGAGLLGYSANYEDILVVGDTNNTVGGFAAPIGQVRKNPGVLGGDNHGDAKRVRLRNITFVNVRDEAVFWWSDMTTHGTSAEGIVLVNTPKRIYFPEAEATSGSFYQPGYFFDKDGSLSGTGEPTALFMNGSPNIGANSTFVAAFNGYRHRVVANGAPIILDNSSAGVTQTGTWTTATSPAGFYGANYLSDGNADKGSKSVAYAPNLPAADWYEVAVQHPAGAALSGAVPLEILADMGAGSSTSYTLEFEVDQKNGGGVWKRVDHGRFLTGSAGKLTVLNRDTTGTVAADAVRFQRMKLE